MLKLNVKASETLGWLSWRKPGKYKTVTIALKQDLSSGKKLFELTGEEMRRAIRDQLTKARARVSDKKLQAISWRFKEASRKEARYVSKEHANNMQSMKLMSDLDVATFSIQRAVENVSTLYREQVDLAELESLLSPLADYSEDAEFALGLVGKVDMDTATLQQEIARSDFLGLGEMHTVSHNYAFAPKVLEAVKASGKDPVVLLESTHIRKEGGWDAIEQSDKNIKDKERLNELFKNTLDNENYSPHQKACLMTYFEILFDQSTSSMVDDNYWRMTMRPAKWFMSGFHVEKLDDQVGKGAEDVRRLNHLQVMRERFKSFKYCASQKIPIQFITPARYEVVGENTHLSMPAALKRTIDDKKYPVLFCGSHHLLGSQDGASKISKHSLNLAEKYNGLSILSRSYWNLTDQLEEVVPVKVGLLKVGRYTAMNLAPLRAKNGERGDLVEYSSDIAVVRTHKHSELMNNERALKRNREQAEKDLADAQDVAAYEMNKRTLGEGRMANG